MNVLCIWFGDVLSPLGHTRLAGPGYRQQMDLYWTADGCHLLQHREFMCEVLPANTGATTPTGSHPGLLKRFYPTYKMCRIELYLAELVIYESEQIETYLEFWTPV